MKLYLAMKYGVHMRQVLGIFDTLEQARETANKAQSLEKDKWHEFDVELFNLNEERI